MTDNKLSSSFRDPSGFLFTRDNVLYRQVNKAYKADYDLLISSGLYGELAGKGLLIPHEECGAAPEAPEIAYKIIRPEKLDFISYPYEWCFSQLKDAAILTLEIQKAAFERGMELKDASAYNVQFRNGKPVFIDTLSFKKYTEGDPWVSYRQFCQHFLAPLALMAHTDIRLSQLLIANIDGIPLDLAAALLPKKTKYDFSLLTHIRMHAKSQKKYADASSLKDAPKGKVGKLGYKGLIDSLCSAVAKLKWEPGGTEWADYYNDTNYTDAALESKKKLVAEYLGKAPRKDIVWDMGANTGVFSRVASGMGLLTVAFDTDRSAVEKNYLACVKNSEAHILPLVMDFTAPSPGIGWNNGERASFTGRGPCGTALALALIHHLCISNNVPLESAAAFFRGVCDSLIIEFVPKNDSQVQRLLMSREDIFPDYTKEGFEQAFRIHFDIVESAPIPGTERTLYLMKSKQ